jgi:thioredoxin reductase (NADPH)
MADRKVIIIGSGPAGLTAALYTARANLKPLLVEGIEAGGQLMLTTMVENWPGFRDGIMGPDLMADMRAQAERFGTDVVQGNVERVDLRSRPFSIAFADGKTLTTEALIIATGASARWLEIGCDRKLSGHGVSTCATCDGYFFRGKPIAVVGGGDSAMEEAIYLTRFASKVTVIHRRDSLRASKIMQDKAFANPKIEFIWDSEIADINDLDRGEVTGIVVRNLKTGKLTDVALDGVFIAIGHTPNTALFRGQLELDEAGYVVTHHGSKTSCPGVFAAGDVQDHI